MNLERLSEATVIMLLAFIGGGAVATLNKPTPTHIPTPAPSVGNNGQPAPQETLNTSPANGQQEVGRVEQREASNTVPQGASLAPAANPPTAAGVLESSPLQPAAEISKATPPANQSACASCAPAARYSTYQPASRRRFALLPRNRR